MRECLLQSRDILAANAMPTEFVRESCKIALSCYYICDLLLVFVTDYNCRIVTEYSSIEHARSIEFPYSGLRLLIA